MSTKTKLIVLTLSFFVAFVFGRWSAPEKIKTETKIQYVDRVVKEKDTQKSTRKETTTVKITHPDGRVEERTTVVEETDRKSETTEKSESKKTEKENTEITRSSSKASVSALAGTKLNSLTSPVYGAAVSKPILGPITVGGFALTDSTVGAMIGLTF